MSQRVVVVGGGLAGLTAAYTLKTQSGGALDVTIIEKSHVLGGKASSAAHRREGRSYDIEHGLHVYFDYPNFDALLRELGATSGLKPNRHRMQMFWNDRLHDFRALPLPAPLHLLLTPRHLGLTDALHFMRFYLAAAMLREERLDDAEKARLDDTSTADFARHLGMPQRLIDTELFRFFERSAFNWRYPTSALSMLRATRLVSQNYRSLRVRYIDGPTYDVLFAPLVTALEERGVNIERFQQAVGLAHDGETVQAVLSRALRKFPHRAEVQSPHLSNYHTVLRETPAAGDDADLDRWEADFVVMALPPNDVDPVLDAPLRALDYFRDIAAIETQPTIAYQVYYDRLVTPDDTEDAVVALPGPFSAVMDRTRHWTKSDNEGSVMILVGELGEWKDKTDAEIMAAGDEQLARFFPKVREAQVVRRWYHRAGHDAFTMTLVGSDRKRPPPQSPLRNMVLTGDFTRNAFGVICMEGAVVSGLEAANAVLQKAGYPTRSIEPSSQPGGFIPVLRWLLNATGLFPHVVGYRER